MAKTYGISNEKIKMALESFQGIERRFTYRIKTDNLVLIDDYAHHPTEINAVYQAVKELYPNQKSLVVFQPHLFSRTRDFMDEFAQSLAQFDEVVLLDIYPARELPIEGISSATLLNKIDNKNKQLTNKQVLEKVIKAADAKIIIMLGAGDISEEIKKLQVTLRQ